MTFNTTSIPILHTRTGVIMPDSGKVLDITALDKKIVKAQSEINYLSGAEAARGTHGGKRFRAKAQSIESRRSAAELKLDQLQTAKDMLLREQWQEPQFQHSVVSHETPVQKSTLSKIWGFVPNFWY